MSELTKNLSWVRPKAQHPMWTKTWSGIILMKSKTLGLPRLLYPDTDPASRAFWPYRRGAVTAFPTALSSPYSVLIYPSSLGVGGVGVARAWQWQTFVAERRQSLAIAGASSPPQPAPSSYLGKHHPWDGGRRLRGPAQQNPAAWGQSALAPSRWCAPPNLSDTSSAQSPPIYRTSGAAGYLWDE